MELIPLSHVDIFVAIAFNLHMQGLHMQIATLSIHYTVLYIPGASVCHLQAHWFPFTF